MTVQEETLKAVGGLAGSEEKRPGRPMNEILNRAILDATIELLTEVEYSRLSFEQVAQKAASTRPAIYRRWRTKADLVLAALKHVFEDSAAATPSQAPVRDKLHYVVTEMVTFAQDERNNRILANMMSAAHLHDELAEVKRFLMNRRGLETRQIIRDGIETGELPSDTDVELLIDQLLGPIFFRSVLLGLPVGDSYADTILAAVLPR